MLNTEPLQSAGFLRYDAAQQRVRAGNWELRLVSPSAGAAPSVFLSGPTSVGSDPACDLCLRDPTVSRRHLELRPTSSGLHVRDLGSTNGTFLGSTRLDAITVTDTATLAVGKSTLQLTRLDVDLGPARHAERFGAAVGKSVRMRELFGVLERAAKLDAPLFLRGETGTGKEVLARAIHAASPRAPGPFVVVDCGSIPESLFESELFGHDVGAFTGASQARMGAFERAQGGTLFLDEVGELSLESQAKLLRVLSAQEFVRLGGGAPQPLDVRILSATHRDLDEAVSTEKFRAALYFRLVVLVAEIPPLRERLEDLPLLARELSSRGGEADWELSPATLLEFQRHPWPGNVRELKNVLERVRAGQAPFDAAHPTPAPAAEQSFEHARDEFTRSYLEKLLESTDGNIAHAARRAGVVRSYLYRLLKKYGLGGK